MHDEEQPLRSSPASQLDGIRGVLSLHREQYAESLRLFLAGKHWTDAAHVAERVLTSDELMRYVDAACKEQETGGAEIKQGEPKRDALSALRHLLARRLAREHRFDEALPYYPADLRATYAGYLADARLGFDPEQTAEIRAKHLWSAALTLRGWGMVLLGTELEPDYAVWGGCYEWPEMERHKPQALPLPEGKGSPPPLESILAPGKPELARIEEAKLPTRRYHYRYKAAELAWLAASLMPNDSEDTAEILDRAGRWIAARAPEEADRFYKTLVVRCPHTRLGALAAERHWLSDGNDD